jgi:hypothetical protein
MDEMREPGMLSPYALTYSLMQISRRNFLAKKFSNFQSFTYVSKALESNAKSNPQVAYQIMATLWVLSFHDYTIEYFGNHNLEIIERMAKLLDYHNQEKIVRIFLLIMDQLKEKKDTEEFMSEIDISTILNKLAARYWVDEGITDGLEKL